jgi:RNA polymerase sigma factor (sigma-70 family)
MSDITNITGRFGKKENESLSQEREKELGEQFRLALENNDEKALEKIREELILRHMRLVLHIGKKFIKNLEWEEIIGAGSLALTHCVSRWHPDKGQMYPWAERWITTGIMRAVDANRTIRIPQGVAYKAGLVKKNINILESELGRTLTKEEKEEVANGVVGFESLPQVAKSLDDKFEESALDSYSSTMEQENADPAEIYEKKEVVETILEAISELNDVEQEVIMVRFGIKDLDRLTLTQLGEKYGMTGEAMRRVESTALAKLRHPALKNPLDLENE